jgi:hypothetical protein
MKRWNLWHHRIQSFHALGLDRPHHVSMENEANISKWGRLTVCGGNRIPTILSTLYFEIRPNNEKKNVEKVQGWGVQRGSEVSKGIKSVFSSMIPSYMPTNVNITTETNHMEKARTPTGTYTTERQTFCSRMDDDVVCNRCTRSGVVKY